jgi:hypothetical protein
MNGKIDIEFEEGCTEPTLELVLPAHMEGTVGTETLIALANFYAHCLTVANTKSLTYGDAWRRQGWMGNLARMMSKMSRIKFMSWQDHAMESADESITDSAIDLANITGFFAINRSEDNKWGGQS